MYMYIYIYTGPLGSTLARMFSRVNIRSHDGCMNPTPQDTSSMPRLLRLGRIQSHPRGTTYSAGSRRVRSGSQCRVPPEGAADFPRIFRGWPEQGSGPPADFSRVPRRSPADFPRLPRGFLPGPRVSPQVSRTVAQRHPVTVPWGLPTVGI